MTKKITFDAYDEVPIYDEGLHKEWIPEVCMNCRGTGMVAIRTKEGFKKMICPVCEGEGEVDYEL